MANELCCMRLHMAGKVIGYLCAVISFLAIIALSCSLGYSGPVDGGVGSFFLAFSVLEFLSSALLIIGTIENRNLYLLPWLIITGIAFAEFFIWLMAEMLSKILNNYDDNILTFVGLFTPIVALLIYIYCVIFSLFQYIKATSVEALPLN